MTGSFRDPDTIRSRIDRHQVPAFLLIVFVWTGLVDSVYYVFGLWGSLPVYINTFPRQWGLPIAAVVVVWANDTPLRGWLGRVFQWRIHPGVYLAAVVLPLFIGEIEPVLAALSGGSVSYSPPASLPLLSVFFLFNVFLLGGVEEWGWRGYLQPQFQGRLSVFGAGIVVGVLWWTWHLPLFLGHPNFTPEPAFLVEYTTFVVGLSTVLGALVNVTDGGVIPAVVMHAMVNVGGIFEAAGGILEGTVPVSLVASGAWWLVAAVLLGLYGRSMVPGDPIDSLS